MDSFLSIFKVKDKDPSNKYTINRQYLRDHVSKLWAKMTVFVVRFIIMPCPILKYLNIYKGKYPTFNTQSSLLIEYVKNCGNYKSTKLICRVKISFWFPVPLTIVRAR